MEECQILFTLLCKHKLRPLINLTIQCFFFFLERINTNKKNSWKTIQRAIVQTTWLVFQCNHDNKGRGHLCCSKHCNGSLLLFFLQARSDSLVIDEFHLALQESKICMCISAFFKYSHLTVMHCNWNFNDFATDLKFQGYKSAVWFSTGWWLISCGLETKMPRQCSYSGSLDMLFLWQYAKGHIPY